MQIQIQFINAEIEDKGKYKMAEIAYKDLVKGQTSSKKLMSFTNPVVYKTMTDAKKGEVYNVDLVKNEKGYWDWTAVALANAVNTVSGGHPEPSGGKASPSPKSTYETAEERAQRQVLIVRQSSAATAVAALKTDKKSPTSNEVIAYAQDLENYVFGIAAQPIPLADLPPVNEDGEDIPY